MLMNRAWKYVRHFWYVAYNWNIWFAFFMFWDSIRGTLKYGGHTLLPRDLQQSTIAGGDARGASRYEAVTFYILTDLLGAFRQVSAGRSIVDLGCGKGRVLITAPYYGFTHVTGVEIAKELCEEATKNILRTARKFPGLSWHIKNLNVNDYDIRPQDAVFFMFNPFDEVVLINFLKRVERSCVQVPRTIYILYANPLHQQVLLDNGYAIIYQKKKMHMESIIAVRD